MTKKQTRLPTRKSTNAVDTQRPPTIDTERYREIMRIVGPVMATQRSENATNARRLRSNIMSARRQLAEEQGVDYIPARPGRSQIGSAGNPANVNLPGHVRRDYYDTERNREADRLYMRGNGGDSP